MRCLQCGNELPDSATFCPSCGANQQGAKPADSAPANARPIPPTEQPKKSQGATKILAIIVIVLGLVSIVVGIASLVGMPNPFGGSKQPTSTSVNDRRISSAGLDSTKLFTDDGYITAYTLSELNGQQLVDLVEDNGFDYVETDDKGSSIHGWKAKKKLITLSVINDGGSTTRTRDEVRAQDIGGKDDPVFITESFPQDAFNAARDIHQACCNVSCIESKESDAGQFAGYFQNSHGDYYVVMTEINRGHPVMNIVPPSLLGQENTLSGAKEAYQDILVNYFHASAG